MFGGAAQQLEALRGARPNSSDGSESPPARQLQRTNSVLVSRASKLEARVKELEAQLAMQHPTPSHPPEPSRELAPQLGPLQEALKERDNRILHLERELQEAQRLERQGQQEKEAVEERLLAAEESRQGQESQLNSLRRKCETLEKRLAEAEAESDALRSQKYQAARELNSKTDELLDLEDQLADTKAALLRSQEALSAAQNERDRLARDLMVQASQPGRLPLATTEKVNGATPKGETGPATATSSLQLVQVQGEMESLRRQLRSSVRRESSREVTLKQQLEEVSGERERLNAALASTEVQKSQLELEVQQLRAQAARRQDAADAELLALKDELNDLQVELNERAHTLEAELQQTRQSLRDALERNQQASARVAELQAELDTQREDLRQQVQGGGTLTVEGEALLHDLLQQVALHEERQAALQAEIDGLTRELAEQRELRAKPDVALEKIQWQLRRAQKLDRQELRQAQQDLSATTSAKMEALRELQALRAQLESKVQEARLEHEQVRTAWAHPKRVLTWSCVCLSWDSG
jgi:nuclear mitotic apparatus protein 1